MDTTQSLCTPCNAAEKMTELQKGGDQGLIDSAAYRVEGG